MATIPQAMQHAIEHHRAGRLRDAETAFRDILARDPGNVEALNNLGHVLHDEGRFAQAVACLEQALALRPDLPGLHFNLANALRACGSLDRAMASYRRALALAPRMAAAYNNLATVEKAIGDFAGAERSLLEALRIDPAYADAHCNLGLLQYHPVDRRLGIVFSELRDWDAARHHFREALRLRPRYAQPHVQLGLLRWAHGEYDAALAHFDEALQIDPVSPEARANRGAILLARGDYAAGWPEHAWSRQSASYTTHTVDVPAWDGAPLAGRTILVHGYHGLGDTLQFVRFLPELRKLGAGRILLAVPNALHPLLAEAGLVELVSPQGPLPSCDVSVGLLYLPCLLKPTEETIPAAPYLRAGAPPLVAKWGKRLRSLGGFQVGIAWQGNRCHAWDHLRSIPLAQFAPLAAVGGVRLIALQEGFGREQLSRLAGSFPVADLGDGDHRSLMDTAAIIANLDLVITCDSAVAHLAGALGAPVWTALPRGADWRWQLDREDSPWYPTMRLFRQQAVGDWQEVFRRMAARLEQLAAQSRATQ
jgi:tetratricopeptide (TPR) repeat protein